MSLEQEMVKKGIKVRKGRTLSNLFSSFIFFNPIIFLAGPHNGGFTNPAGHAERFSVFQTSHESIGLFGEVSTVTTNEGIACVDVFFRRVNAF
jgi:hypothetical protein